MKFYICLILILLTSAVAMAQVEYVTTDYFPAEFEFQELQTIKTKEAIKNPAQLLKIENGRLFIDAGCEKYERRRYEIPNSGVLLIEIATMQDARAAFSLFTLLREADIRTGPPGDAFSIKGEELIFVHKNIWARIKGQNAPQDLPLRIAQSISNRIGARKPKPPSLVSHLPKEGCEPSSVKYFSDIKLFEAYSGKIAGRQPKVDFKLEVVQARYSMDNKAGVLSIVSFPTPETADDYYAQISSLTPNSKEQNKVYCKKSGPLVAVLEGGFDPNGAEKILKTIQHSYSVRWIYESDKTKITWGVPGSILATVVKSFFLVALLAIVSVFIGAGIAFFRRMLRKRSSENPDGETDAISRLKMK